MPGQKVGQRMEVGQRHSSFRLAFLRPSYERKDLFFHGDIEGVAFVLCSFCSMFGFDSDDSYMRAG